MPDFVLEIGVEEMPAGMIEPALEQMQQAMAEGLKELRLGHGNIETMGTPRRLAVLVDDIQQRQPDQELVYKGPPADRAFTEDGDPTDAAIGFAKAKGVEVRDLNIDETDNGTFVFARTQETGQPAVEVLPELLVDLTEGLSFPKMMRWGECDMRFGRPIRWIVALLGEEIVPFEIAGVTSGNMSRGHRFVSDGAVEVSEAARYEEVMDEARVMVDHRQRRKCIIRQAREAAAAHGGEVVLDEDTLTENIFSVEMPSCVVGTFASRYLALPDEVLATVMEKHQTYFPVADSNGHLMTQFIIISNVDNRAEENVRLGNEKVIEARLADAEFYIEEDTKEPPEERLDELRRVSYLEGLGTLYDKTTRLEAIGKWLCERVNASDEVENAVNRAALLSKTDQISLMIGDTKLASLQGIAGAHYARQAGEPSAVCEAIAEQYMPVRADGELPGSLAGALLAIADKSDDLCASFYLGMEPTGARDPMGLRRQAQGIIQICVDRGLRFSLDDLISLNMGLLPDLPEDKEPVNVVERAKSLKSFIAGRIDSFLQAEGVAYDTVRAVLATKWREIVGVVKRGRELSRIREEDPEFEQTVDMATRPANIVRPSDLPDDATIAPGLFEESIEESLWDAYQQASDDLDSLLTNGADISAAWNVLKGLRSLIDRYFDTVMVNVDDEALRTNRLAVMRAFDELFCRVADFTEIVQ
ncbi:MAG: glycine--tRNA ligase subunit beta [Armatimonadota bacterium]